MILGCLAYPMIKNYAIATIWATMDGASMIVCASKGPKLRKEQAEKKKDPQVFDLLFWREIYSPDFRRWF